MESEVSTEPYLKYRVKKSKRVDYADTLEIILESEYVEEENYYFVSFNEVDRKVKKFHNNVWGLKATRLWISGKEVYIEETGHRGVSETIFCPYKENCEGICKHDIGLGRYGNLSLDDPFYDEKVAKTKSIQGILNWFKDKKEGIKPNYGDEYVLVEMENLSIINLNEDEKKYILDKQVLEKYICKKLGFELEYCPKFSKEDTLNVISDYPDEILLSEEIMNYLTRERTDSETTISGDEIADTEEIERDKWEYEKKQAELIGEEVEERLRKVLNEFFDKKT